MTTIISKDRVKNYYRFKYAYNLFERSYIDCSEKINMNFQKDMARLSNTKWFIRFIEIMKIPAFTPYDNNNIYSCEISVNFFFFFFWKRKRKMCSIKKYRVLQWNGILYARVYKWRVGVCKLLYVLLLLLCVRYFKTIFLFLLNIF